MCGNYHSQFTEQEVKTQLLIPYPTENKRMIMLNSDFSSEIFFLLPSISSGNSQSTVGS